MIVTVTYLIPLLICVVFLFLIAINITTVN